MFALECSVEDTPAESDVRRNVPDLNEIIERCIALGFDAKPAIVDYEEAQVWGYERLAAIRLKGKLVMVHESCTARSIPKSTQRYAKARVHEVRLKGTVGGIFYRAVPDTPRVLFGIPARLLRDRILCGKPEGVLFMPLEERPPPLYGREPRIRIWDHKDEHGLRQLV